MAHKPPLGKIKWLHQAIEEGGDCLWCKKPISLWGYMEVCAIHDKVMALYAQPPRQRSDGYE